MPRRRKMMPGESSAEQLSSIQCAAVGQSILADLKLQGSEVRSGGGGGDTLSIQLRWGKCALKPLSSQAVTSAEYLDDFRS